ncbi:putative inorganic phosphate cotransporter [Anthonomus grandis grandis]|uniref:putative inorganic phosphate cotransporter n=1 Tax=Anthonomus grandis grandis TaxID=2921223 RepID=UPI0021665318|nr:putative inorganic phosphate cotransporter [Anthonomus grandis grandis]
MATKRKVSIMGDRNREKKVSIAESKVDFTKIQDSKEREIHILGYDASNKGPMIGARHIQMLLLFVCLTIGFAMRTNLSVAIVAMTDPNSAPADCNVPYYTWNNRSIILSSFFWGYVCLQVAAGYLGRKYGPKYFLLCTFSINCVAFMFIPLAAKTLGSTGVIICRIVQGLTQGFMFPSSHTILGKWAPTEERSTMGILVYSGVSFGSVIAYIVAGYISSSCAGWPATFYLFGGLGIGWSIFYLIFGQNNPASHPYITPEERRYIEVSLDQTEDTDFPVPWKEMLTSKHVWAIFIANTGGSWGYAMMMTQIPTYLKNVMGFTIATSGVVSAVPYIVGTITGLIFAPLCDFLIMKGFVSVLNARRIFQLFGAYGMVICLLLLGYTDCTKTTAVLLLALGNAAYSATLVGYSVNHVDLSPRFSGILQGISNGTSQGIAIFAPVLVQFVVTGDQTDASQWRIIFLVTAIIYFVCATIFAIFASATRQKWDGPSTESRARAERIKKQSVISVTGY